MALLLYQINRLRLYNVWVENDFVKFINRRYTYLLLFFENKYLD